MSSCHLQISRKYPQNSFRTKIDFNETIILELSERLEITVPSINMSIFHNFMWALLIVTVP